MLLQFKQLSFVWLGEPEFLHFAIERASGDVEFLCRHGDVSAALLEGPFNHVLVTLTER